MTLKENAVLPVGFSAAGCAAGIKKSGKPDCAVFYSESPAVAAACFTTNKVIAAPVIYCQKLLSRGRAGFRGQSALRTWLVGILNHKVVDLIRERQRKPAVALDAFDAAVDDEQCAAAGAPFAAVHEGAAAEYERRAFCAEVLAELEAYSPKAARIFMMREIEGEETGAICRRLRVSNANCYVLLHRARQFLHQRFGAQALAA
jgi:RNA polymerase sigma factor (sigma-70 family)